ncbi:hypothetical protein Mrose_02285 [Calidithermus roseus]|uniref:Uncharacterized protein n=1 Tax=Calidithermus roseus TaxID=1644118 RepID=A0A399EN69_9DEIN|nr:hypothetical protein Mrose_02285 [Calidithermus roseus]
MGTLLQRYTLAHKGLYLWPRCRDQAAVEALRQGDRHGLRPQQLAGFLCADVGYLGQTLPLQHGPVQAVQGLEQGLAALQLSLGVGALEDQAEQGQHLLQGRDPLGRNRLGEEQAQRAQQGPFAAQGGQDQAPVAQLSPMPAGRAGGLLGQAVGQHPPGVQRFGLLQGEAGLLQRLHTHRRPQPQAILP